MEHALIFATPRRLPAASACQGRVVVLDIAFASTEIGRGFARTTGTFITDLGPKLARWVDHHDHPMHVQFAGDERFVLATKAQHGACPEMITPELVRTTGPVDTIVCHSDLDGLYAAAKWALQGREPYAGADDDARAIDTRMGEPSARAVTVDYALRAGFSDDTLKRRVVRFLITGMRKGTDLDTIEAAAAAFEPLAMQAKRLAQHYVVEGPVARVSVPSEDPPYDKTELLLLGQALAPIALVVGSGQATFAASFESGIDFVRLFELGGGMPTRVTIPQKRLASALEAIAAAFPHP